MSDSLYAKFNAVLIGILARLDLLELKLDRLTEKAPVINDQRGSSE